MTTPPFGPLAENQLDLNDPDDAHTFAVLELSRLAVGLTANEYRLVDQSLLRGATVLSAAGEVHLNVVAAMQGLRRLLEAARAMAEGEGR